MKTLSGVSICCGTCKHHRHGDEDEWLCANEDSINFTEETDYNDACADWEEREK